MGAGLSRKEAHRGFAGTENRISWAEGARGVQGEAGFFCVLGWGRDPRQPLPTR